MRPPERRKPEEIDEAWFPPERALPFARRVARFASRQQRPTKRESLRRFALTGSQEARLIVSARRRARSRRRRGSVPITGTRATGSPENVVSNAGAARRPPLIGRHFHRPVDADNGCARPWRWRRRSASRAPSGDWRRARAIRASRPSPRRANNSRRRDSRRPRSCRRRRGEARRKAAADVVRERVAGDHRVGLALRHRGQRRIEPQRAEAAARAIGVELADRGGRVDMSAGELRADRESIGPCQRLLAAGGERQRRRARRGANRAAGGASRAHRQTRSSAQRGHNRPQARARSRAASERARAPARGRGCGAP